MYFLQKVQYSVYLLFNTGLNSITNVVFHVLGNVILKKWLIYFHFQPSTRHTSASFLDVLFDWSVFRFNISAASLFSSFHVQIKAFCSSMWPLLMGQCGFYWSIQLLFVFLVENFQRTCDLVTCVDKMSRNEEFVYIEFVLFHYSLP